MFAIYNPNGRQFSGTLEKLKKIEKANRSIAPTKHNALDDLHTIIDTSEKKSPHNNYHVGSKTIEAYKQTVKKNDKSPIYHAYQVMSAPVEILRDTNTLKVALEKLKTFSYQDFPIINNKNELVGTLSRQRVYEHLLTNKTNYLESNSTKTLSELFLNDQSKAYSAEPVTDIRRIAALFIEKRINALPIIENTGKIVGIISREDILAATTIDPPLSLWC